ncbi:MULTISPECIES: tetraacyldisaccharide 4'-kinase [unclassified Flavobacterium]|uniref:tetraacyldisaccharide 4'-kinase n=1 Tax=unclassified Flavobacterium TaxID=196869 RepID=UPI001291969E|nr:MULTISPECIES: tetraacyldisaccharide 4'-kinase [unclassified Flavobacterium]MQP53027.1 tetraacyldisaccharide 4'-kinase [Flavobacterium sp. LMO9]MQP62848.1 tetraacyldisaccharide 4'-kinase [Flavobacterium sp. LMO6]
MILLRKILFPVAFLYWLITYIRNCLYDKGIFKSYAFDIPIIAVGNLSVGGTGKTPQIEYLIRLLSDGYKIAVLSRGYKRSTAGFILADDTATASSIGDEPFQFFSKFPKIQVAVDANRKNGIENLLQLKDKPDVILLDDAFQHRKVKAGFYILLTAYDDLFCNDYILPFGNLREPSSGKKRADMIIVTKCPSDLSELAQQKIREKLNVTQSVFFTTIQYDDFVFGNDSQLLVSEIKKESKVLVAGIAKPKLFFEFLQSDTDETLVFPDHHHFSKQDCEQILAKAKGRKIITTEKDFVRLNGLLPKAQLFYLPIKSAFLNNKNIDKTIKDYVGKGSRNS